MYSGVAAEEGEGMLTAMCGSRCDAKGEGLNMEAVGEDTEVCMDCAGERERKL